jgi:hypothetical protein
VGGARPLVFRDSAPDVSSGGALLLTPRCRPLEYGAPLRREVAQMRPLVVLGCKLLLLSSEYFAHFSLEGPSVHASKRRDIAHRSIMASLIALPLVERARKETLELSEGTRHFLEGHLSAAELPPQQP